MTMNNLAKLLVFKIVATLCVWCIPLILFPSQWLEACGIPHLETYLFARMLGWAYLSLCVGYAIGLRDELQGKRNMGVIYVGIASNGGGCAYLLYYGAVGTFSGGLGLQIIGWGSSFAAGFITIGLIFFGLVQGPKQPPKEDAKPNGKPDSKLIN